MDDTTVRTFFAIFESTDISAMANNLPHKTTYQLLSICSSLVCCMYVYMHAMGLKSSQEAFACMNWSFTGFSGMCSCMHAGVLLDGTKIGGRNATSLAAAAWRATAAAADLAF